jgi:hypothetical protein
MKRIILLLDGTWNDSDFGNADTNIVRMPNDRLPGIWARLTRCPRNEVSRPTAALAELAAPSAHRAAGRCPDRHAVSTFTLIPEHPLSGSTGNPSTVLAEFST